jgi:hypothetical protein
MEMRTFMGAQYFVCTLLLRLEIDHADIIFGDAHNRISTHVVSEPLGGFIYGNHIFIS